MPKISGLDPAGALMGTEAIPLSPSGATTTKRTTVDQIAARATVAAGLGSMATQNAGAVAITGGSIAGVPSIAAADLSNVSATAFGGRAFISTGALTPRNGADRGKDVARMEDFGGVADGLTNNTSVLDAIAAAYPDGGVVIDGGGLQNYWRTNSPWLAPDGFSNVTLRDFRIYNPDHGFDFITLPDTVGEWRIQNLFGVADNPASGSSNHYLINSAALGLETFLIYGNNMFSGVYLGGPKHYLRGTTQFTSLRETLGDGIVISQPTGVEVCEVDRAIILSASGAEPRSGVNVIQGSSIRVAGIATHCVNGLLVDPGAGQVVATLTLDFNGDNCLGAGAWFAGTGAIQRVEGFVRLTSNGSDGLLSDNIADSADLILRLSDNVGRGAYFKAGDYKNSRFRCAAYGNNLHGVEFEACTNFTAEVSAGDGDGFGTNTQYGLVIGSGSDHFTASIDGDGGILGQVFNGAGTSATKVLTTRA